MEIIGNSLANEKSEQSKKHNQTTAQTIARNDSRTRWAIIIYLTYTPSFSSWSRRMRCGDLHASNIISGERIHHISAALCWRWGSHIKCTRNTCDSVRSKNTQTQSHRNRIHSHTHSHTRETDTTTNKSTTCSTGISAHRRHRHRHRHQQHTATHSPQSAKPNPHTFYERKLARATWKTRTRGRMQPRSSGSNIGCHTSQARTPRWQQIHRSMAVWTNIRAARSSSKTNRSKCILHSVQLQHNSHKHSQHSSASRDELFRVVFFSMPASRHANVEWENMPGFDTIMEWWNMCRIWNHWLEKYSLRYRFSVTENCENYIRISIDCKYNS